MNKLVRRFFLNSKILNILLIVLVVTFVITSSSFSQVRLIHSQISFAEANKAAEVTVQVDGEFSSADEMRVYYRAQGEDTYDYVILESIGSEFQGSIPGYPFSAVAIEYFFSFIKDSEIITLPTTNPYFNPLKIELTPQTEQTVTPPVTPPVAEPPRAVTRTGNQLSSDDYLILSPEPGERLAPEDVIIALSIFLDPSALDSSLTEVYLDNRAINAEITSDLITYTPSTITVGTHKIEIILYDSSGTAFAPIQWSFQITGAQVAVSRATTRQPLIRGATGSIYAESKLDKYSGIERNNHQLGAQIRGKSGKIRYGSRVYITSLEEKELQPRNRFLFWIEAGPVSLYAGDTSPRFSELILWGRRVRGMEAQLNLKFINFDFVMGQINRGIKPIGGAPGTFQRDLTALRTSFGSGRYFQLGISAVKVKDDVNSITGGIRPKDNLVGGADISINLFKNRLKWKAEVAGSLLTDDISSGPLTKAEIEDLVVDVDVGFDPADYEDYLVINTSTVPLDPTDFTSGAYSTSLQLRLGRNDFRIKYKSIGAAYNSLANSFLRKNIRGLLITDRVRLFKNRVYLNLSYENYDDNFKAEDDNPTVALQTFRGGLNIFPGPGMPNLSINYKTYSRNNDVSIIENINGVDIDKREDNTTSDVTVNLNHEFIMFDLDHTISLSYITMKKTDDFSNTRLNTSIPIGIDNDIQSISLQTKFKQPLITRISYAENDNSSLGGLSKFKFKIFNFRAEYKAMQEKLMLYSGYRMFQGEGGGGVAPSTLIIDYTKNQFSIGGKLDISSRSALIFDGSFIDFKDSGSVFDAGTNQLVPNNSFTDRTIRIRFETQI